MRNGTVMARPNQELCENIYAKYKDVLDEIFLAIKQETPEGPKPKTQTYFGTPLSRLFDAGLVWEGDVLFSRYHDADYHARFDRCADGTVVIEYNGQEYKTPSAAGKAITQLANAGWDFWRVRTTEGISKGTLSELRRDLPETLEETKSSE